MATCTFWSLDLQEQLHPPKQNILDQVKHAEKRIFPRKEAYDFDAEMKKRNLELIVLLDHSGSSGCLVPVAYAVYAYTPKVASLHKICVLDKYRRRGIAKLIMVSQQQKIASRGCGKIQLWVDEDRLPARQLYSSLGFAEVGRREDYYGPGRTGLSMILKL
ncbi:MAG: hypothetical protein Q9220_004270 [cf. Caloplaca sp. 1 TL-2023]